MLTRYYLVHLKSTKIFLFHLWINLCLSFIALTCFLVVIVRDPGRVDATKAQTVEDASMPTAQPDLPQPEEGEELSLLDALMPAGSAKDDGDWTGNGGRRWCKVVRRSFSMTSPSLMLNNLS